MDPETATNVREFHITVYVPGVPESEPPGPSWTALSRLTAATRAVCPPMAGWDRRRPDTWEVVFADVGGDTPDSVGRWAVTQVSAALDAAGLAPRPSHVEVAELIVCANCEELIELTLERCPHCGFDIGPPDD